MSMQSVASAAISHHPPKRNLLAHIPGDEGWPVIGRTLAILADPKGEVERMAAKHGLVYRSRVLGETSITVLGPEANEFVLFDQSKLFSSTYGWEIVLGRLFPRGLMLLDFDEHRLHRRALSVAFKSGPMKSYLAALDVGILERVTRWRQLPGPMLFYPAMKQLTLDLAATSFLGEGIGPEVDEITRAFIDMVAAAVAPIRHPSGARKWRAASKAAPASSPISRNRSRCAAPRKVKTCSRSYAAPPTRTARCCRPRISSIT
jgi:cytochrome P450